MKIPDIDRLNAERRARETLYRAEVDTLTRIALENKAEDRKEYRDLRDTLDALDGANHRRLGFVHKLLKGLHLVP